ncbi:hypothetical protein A2U01_0081116, partial [Trifolium medium]|nr:hypothetical protein [Trifolium medium]
MQKNSCSATVAERPSCLLGELL